MAAREVMARIASHYPKVAARGPLATRAALEALKEAGAGLDDPPDERSIYTRSCGLADPARAVSSSHVEPIRPLKRSHPEPLFRPLTPAPTWMAAVDKLCAGFEGATAWAIGGDEELAERFHRAHVLPVAVSVRTERDVEGVAVDAEHDQDLARLRIGIVAMTKAYTVPPRRSEWALDRRIRRAIDESWIPRLMERLRDSRWQPFVHPSSDDRHARDMLLRWHLTSFHEVECAGWLYGRWIDGAVLAVLVSDEAVMVRIEEALAGPFPTVSVIQVCSPQPEPLIDAIRVGRVRKGTHWDTTDLDLAELVPQLADAFADPDVYERDWMLAAPPDPIGEALVTERREEDAVASARTVQAMAVAANASCPRCGVEYWLPADTPLGQTCCGLCRNPCLVPRARRMPHFPGPTRQRRYRCPSCELGMTTALTNGAIHARCPHCTAAVLPVPQDD